jgi:hypothetical protein
MSAPPMKGMEQHLRQSVFKDRVAALNPIAFHLVKSG